MVKFHAAFYILTAAIVLQVKLPHAETLTVTIVLPVKLLNRVVIVTTVLLDFTAILRVVQAAQHVLLVSIILVMVILDAVAVQVGNFSRLEVLRAVILAQVAPTAPEAQVHVPR